jgi:hypothetical protein
MALSLCDHSSFVALVVPYVRDVATPEAVMRLVCWWVGTALVIAFILIVTPGRPWANAHPELRDGTKFWY